MRHETVCIGVLLVCVAVAGGLEAAAPVPAGGEGPAVTLALTTAMPTGAVFVEWRTAGSAVDLCGHAFVGRSGSSPVEVTFAAREGRGELRVYVVSKDGREVRFARLEAELVTGPPRRLVVVDQGSRPVEMRLE